MKLRHAAALALVGWYLMLPSDGKGPNWNGWTVVATFITKADCEAAATNLRTEAYNSSAVDRSETDSIAFKRMFKTWQMENATCSAFSDSHTKSS